MKNFHNCDLKSADVPRFRPFEINKIRARDQRSLYLRLTLDSRENAEKFV